MSKGKSDVETGYSQVLSEAGKIAKKMSLILAEVGGTGTHIGVAW